MKRGTTPGLSIGKRKVSDMGQELLPCPICGGMPSVEEVLEVGPLAGIHTVHCPDCYDGGPMRWGIESTDAIADWNEYVEEYGPCPASNGELVDAHISKLTNNVNKKGTGNDDE